MRSVLIVLSAISIFLGGCRSTRNASDAESLNNFARPSGALSSNMCGTGTPESDMADVELIDAILADQDLVDLQFARNQAATKAALKQALRSVPTVLLAGFFNVAGGRIIASQSTPVICAEKFKTRSKMSSTFATEGTEAFSSCWDSVIEEIDNKNSSEFKDAQTISMLYISDDPSKISHGLVRGMGLILAQNLGSIDLDSSSKLIVESKDEQAAMNSHKMRLAEALLLDVLHNSSKYNLALYQESMASVLSTKTEEARLAAWKKLLAEKPDTANLFADFVYAESFDSYYCSKESRQIMEADFALTFEEFTSSQSGLSDIEKEIPKVDSKNELTISDAQNLADVEEVEAIESVDVQSAPRALKSSLEASAKSTAVYSLFRGRILGGLGRAIVGIARGIGRIGVGVFRAIGRVAVGAVRVIGRVAVGVGRLAVGLVRATGRVLIGAARLAVGVIRATGRVVGRLIRGAVRIVGAVAIGAARVIGWTIRATGVAVRGLFGPFFHLSGCPSMQCTGFQLAAADLDNDGIMNEQDMCSNTSKSAVIHKTGSYMGCAGGQNTDSTISYYLTHGGYDGQGDYDKDGVKNDEDLCSNTPTAAVINKSAEWMGCAQGQNRDSDILSSSAAPVSAQPTSVQPVNPTTQSGKLDCNKDFSTILKGSSGICFNSSSGFCYKYSNKNVNYDLGQVACN